MRGAQDQILMFLVGDMKEVREAAFRKNIRRTVSRAILCLVFLIDFTSCRKHDLRVDDAVEDSLPISDEKFVEEIKSAVESSNGQPLEFDSEVHAWIRVGDHGLQDYVHFWRCGATWYGEYYLLWHNRSQYDLTERKKCLRIVRSDHYTICQLAESTTLGYRVGMSELATSLVNNGIEVLPNPEDLNVAYGGVLDGETLLVELKSRVIRRNYQYRSPSKYNFPEAKRAQVLLQTMRKYRMEFFEPYERQRTLRNGTSK